jgi:prevent-host-death family protein
MEIIGAFDAKTRLSELLDRASRGESFQITKHGRPVGKIVPPDTAPDRAAIARAVETLRSFRGMFQGMTRDDLANMKHEGHRY